MQHPIPSIEGRPEITRGVALQAVAEAMYDDSTWPALSRALTSAQRGDGAALLRMYDDYYSVQRVTARGATSWKRSRRSTAWTTTYGVPWRRTMPRPRCSRRWHPDSPRTPRAPTSARSSPRPTDPLIEVTGAGAGPIVLCGTTGNASTPLEGTRAMADALEDGRLIVVDTVASACAGASACGDQLMTDYLVDLEVPPTETECPGD